MLRRTALIVAVPEADPHVEAIRLEHDWSASVGVPAHVTVLFPFAPPEAIDTAALGDTFAALAPFAFALDRVERFDTGLTWLHPEPSEPFEELTRTVWLRWPEHPPYGGAHDVVVPHLTVSETPLELDLPLPIHAVATGVSLIEEASPGGRWSVRARYPLGVA
jgi:hypothetical protein